MNKRKFLKPSLLVIFLVALFSFSTWEQWINWKRGQSTQFVSDVTYYYCYLPAAFSYHDLRFTYPNQYGLLKGDGFKVPKYTCGMAILYAPFFFVGQAIAENPEDEFDEAYATSIHLGSIFYFIVGLIFLRNTLVRFFSETISSILLLTVIFGTNLFYYVFTEGEMSHGYLFCLVTIFIWLTIRWHEKANVKAGVSLSIPIGLVFGLITLIRPSDAIFFLVFLLYDVHSLATLKEKIKLLISRWKDLLVIMVMVFLVFLPQLFFWKYVTGSFLYFSYHDEGFFFSDPRIMEVLFSYRKGFFVYTPVMALALIGLFFLQKQVPRFSAAIPVFFVFNLYIISSWWCWWYGGSYGMRAMIESYPLLLLALGSLLSYTSKKFRWLNVTKKYGLPVLILLCIYLNMLQTMQYKKGMLHCDSMNKNAYWHIFGKLHHDTWDDEWTYYKMLTKIDYEAAQKGINRESY